MRALSLLGRREKKPKPEARNCERVEENPKSLEVLSQSERQKSLQVKSLNSCGSCCISVRKFGRGRVSPGPKPAPGDGSTLVRRRCRVAAVLGSLSFIFFGLGLGVHGWGAFFWSRI